MTPREFILNRFSLQTSRRRGGVSSAQIFGRVGTQKFSIGALEEELKKLRDEGVLGFTGGLWWKRRHDVA